MRELDARIRNLIESRRRLRAHLSNGSTEVGDRAAQPGLAPADRAFMERVYAAIEKRLDDPEFGVSELADAVAQDRSHLFRRTRQLINETPSEVIRRLRLEAATEAAAGGDRNRGRRSVRRRVQQRVALLTVVSRREVR
jgi:AraC-like DNA-binding protein